MKKLATIAALSILAITSPALAETTAEANQDVQSDAVAVNKDNAAIAKQNAHAAHHRAVKAKAKADGDVATQAGQSLAIGGNDVAVGEKKVERGVDQKILNHDQGDAADATANGNAR